MRFFCLSGYGSPVLQRLKHRLCQINDQYETHRGPIDRMTARNRKTTDRHRGSHRYALCATVLAAVVAGHSAVAVAGESSDATATESRAADAGREAAPAITAPHIAPDGVTQFNAAHILIAEFLKLNIRDPDSNPETLEQIQQIMDDLNKSAQATSEPHSGRATGGSFDLFWEDIVLLAQGLHEYVFTGRLRMVPHDIALIPGFWEKDGGEPYTGQMTVSARWEPGSGEAMEMVMIEGDLAGLLTARLQCGTDPWRHPEQTCNVTKLAAMADDPNVGIPWDDVYAHTRLPITAGSVLPAPAIDPAKAPSGVGMRHKQIDPAKAPSGRSMRKTDIKPEAAPSGADFRKQVDVPLEAPPSAPTR